VSLQCLIKDAVMVKDHHRGVSLHDTLRHQRALGEPIQVRMRLYESPDHAYERHRSRQHYISPSCSLLPSYLLMMCSKDKAKGIRGIKGKGNGSCPSYASSQWLS